MLTERQQAVLDFIRDHQQNLGLPPSTRQIQRHFGFKAQNAAFCHLRALAAKGMLVQLDGRTWGLQAKAVQGHLFDMPVYGAIPAGLPAMQEQEPGGDDRGRTPRFSGCAGRGRGISGSCG